MEGKSSMCVLLRKGRAESYLIAGDDAVRLFFELCDKFKEIIP
jgi:hypothetical protein